MRINKMRDYYKDWSELDHYLGYKVTYSEYENTDYDNIKSDNPNDWSYQVYKSYEICKIIFFSYKKRNRKGE
jgi:hypothetical protein